MLRVLYLPLKNTTFRNFLGNMGYMSVKDWGKSKDTRERSQNAQGTCNKASWSLPSPEKGRNHYSQQPHV